MVAAKMFRLGAISAALLFPFSSVIVETSLYIPGFDEQPVSVTVLGVDSDGRTTWQIVPGEPTGTIPPAPFPVTATMVQGPSDAVVHASFPQIEVSLSCALNSGLADCVGEIEQPDMTMTTSLRESVKPFLVQGGGSGGGSSPPSPTPTPSQSGSPPSVGQDDGSAVITAVMAVGMLAGNVVAVMVNLFLV